MDMCLYPLLSKAGFQSFKVSPRIFEFAVYLQLIERGNEVKFHCDRNWLDNLEEDHLHLVRSASKIFHMRQDLFRSPGSIKRYKDLLEHTPLLCVT